MTGVWEHSVITFFSKAKMAVSGCQRTARGGRHLAKSSTPPRSKRHSLLSTGTTAMTRVSTTKILLVTSENSAVAATAMVRGLEEDSPPVQNHLPTSVPSVSDYVSPFL